MMKLFIGWMAVVGVGTYFLFNGLIQGMPSLEVAVAKIFSIAGM